MPTLSDFDPVGLAHEIPTAREWDRAVFEALQRQLGFEAAFVAVKGEAPSTVVVDASRLDAAVQGADYYDDMARWKVAAARTGHVAVDTDVFGERRVRAMGHYRDFMRPMGGRHSLMGFLSVRGRPMGAVMLGRCGSSFTERETRAMAGMLPSLAVARASYRAPWQGGPLPPAPAETSPWSRVARWMGGAQELARVDGDEGAVIVRDVDRHREMVSSSSGGDLVWTRASLDAPSRSGWFYVELFHLAAARARRHGRALFLGCGGGVAVRRFAEVYPGLAMDVVERDPRVLDLARRWFDLDAVPGVTAHVAEGAAFVASAAPSTWDVVIVDAYDGASLAAPLARPSFFTSLRRALRPGGAAAYNVIGRLGGSGDVAHVASEFRRALDDVRLVPVLDPGEAFSPSARRNVVVLGTRPGV